MVTRDDWLVMKGKCIDVAHIFGLMSLINIYLSTEIFSIHYTQKQKKKLALKALRFFFLGPYEFNWDYISSQLVVTRC
jgi:hypothetical protein